MQNFNDNSTYANEEFTAFLEEIDNQSCFDCGGSNAAWASVNNAIYLCMNCAALHRGFGVSYSFIRSITIEYVE